MNKEEVLKIALEQETIDNLLEGDIWVDLDIKTVDELFFKEFDRSLADRLYKKYRKENRL